MLLGPPAIGFMADWFSLPAALTGVAVPAAVATVVGFATRHVHTDRLRAVPRPSGWRWEVPDQVRGAGVPG